MRVGIVKEGKGRLEWWI